MGSRYGQLSSAASLADTPSPARAIVHHSIDLFSQTDRGLVRNHNDKTMDSRTAYFRDWLSQTCRYRNVCCAQRITTPQAIGLLAAYTDHIRDTPYSATGALRQANTVQHFLKTAIHFLVAISDHSIDVYDRSGTTPALPPILKDKIQQLRKWQTIKPKREAYTFEMLDTLHDQVKVRRIRDERSFLGKDALVFDTQCLGVFTGSRVSEYCQTVGRVQQLSRVPAKAGENPSSCLPIAFIRSDFLFLAADGNILPHPQLFQDPCLPVQLQVTFRHDKSGRNSTVRKYGRGKSWLCPIRATINILFRAEVLRVPQGDPVCAYKSSDPPGYRFLRDSDVTHAMRQIVIATYPNPTHFLRVHITRISSHCNRIYAAVSLRQAGESIATIAQRLRWSEESVSHYLRESATDIGNYTASTIMGAHRAFL